MRRPSTSLPLALAALADITLAQGQREAASELINEAYAVADAATKKRGTTRQRGPRASAMPPSPRALVAA
jgi:hypothetical protein